MKLATTAVFALALAAGAAMAAEDIYRSVMPDGSIRYGESPDPAAKSYKKVAAPPPSTGVTVVTPEEKGRNIPAQPGGVTVIPPPPKQAGLPPGAPIGVNQGNSTELPRRSY